MPALNYAPEFAPKVERGEKPNTIRAKRVHPVKVGDTLYHFTGMRRPECRRLGYSIAETVLAVDIFSGACKGGPSVYMATGPAADSGQRRLTRAEVEALATADGFDTVADFYAWFVGGKHCIFTGQFIAWPTTWTPATCPNCGDAADECHEARLYCGNCEHIWSVGEGV